MDDFEAARMARHALADVRHGIEVFEASVEVLEGGLPEARRRAREAMDEFADAVATSERGSIIGLVRMLGAVHPPLGAEYEAVRTGMAGTWALRAQVREASRDLRAAEEESARIGAARGRLDGLGLEGATPSGLLDRLDGRGGMAWTWGLLTGRTQPLEKAIEGHSGGLEGFRADVRTAALAQPDTGTLQARVAQATRAGHAAVLPDLSSWREAFSTAVTARIRVDIDDHVVGMLAIESRTPGDVQRRAFHPQRLAGLRRGFQEKVAALRQAEAWLERALVPPVMSAAAVRGLPSLAKQASTFAGMVPYTREQMSPSVLEEAFKAPRGRAAPSPTSGTVQPEMATAGPGLR